MSNDKAPHAVDILSPESQAHNVAHITSIRSLASIVGGTAAGILGLTNMMGVFMFIFVMMLTSVAIQTALTSQNKTVFQSSIDVYTEGVGGAFLSFVLFWTLIYDFVHIY